MVLCSSRAIPFRTTHTVSPIDRVSTGSTNMIQPVACSSSCERAIHSPIIVQLPSHMGGGGVFCHNALLHGSHSMGHERLPYTTHAPIAIQGSHIKMSDMNHEGQILHIGYGHHTGVTNNIRGHASVYTGYEHFCHTRLSRTIATQPLQTQLAQLTVNAPIMPRMT